MEMPRALIGLAESLQARKQQGKPSYIVLLTSTITLTPEVLIAICRSAYVDWQSFCDYIGGRGSEDQVSLLSGQLDTSENQERFASLARLIQAGYFTTIFTTSPDSALEQALSSSQLDVLVVDKDSDSYIASKLDKLDTRAGIHIIKLHGSLRHGVLSQDYPNFFEIRDPLHKKVKRYLNQDLLVIGSIERENDILPLLKNNRSSIYYTLPDTQPPQDGIIRVMNARRLNLDSFLISGQYGQFETFCSTLESLLSTSASPVEQKPVLSRQPASKPPTTRPPEPAQKKTQSASLGAQAVAQASINTQREEIQKQTGQAKRPRRFPKVRLTLLVIGLILIITGAILWFLSNAQVINASLFNILTIIFGVLSLAVGWIFGLFPVSPDESETGESEPSYVPSNEQKLSFQEAHQVQPIQNVENFNQYQFFYAPDQHVSRQPTFNTAPPQPDSMTIDPPIQTKETSVSGDTKTNEEGNIPKLPNRLHDNTIELANKYYKAIMESKDAASYADRLFDTSQILDSQYDRLIAFLHLLSTPVRNLLETVNHLPAYIRPYRFPLVTSLEKAKVVTDDLEKLMARRDRASLGREIQHKFRLLLDTIDEVSLSFSELCSKFQDDA
jgi:hypothetical protein